MGNISNNPLIGVIMCRKNMLEHATLIIRDVVLRTGGLSPALAVKEQPRNAGRNLKGVIHARRQYQKEIRL